MTHREQKFNYCGIKIEILYERSGMQPKNKSTILYLKYKDYFS